ncbi:unnamed protein product [Polarella glacialis]|uniref:Succinate dehydrogenase assembly factor 2, mitochondrial n=1 Tax=Polarella glacialis TaxID=89957 RepID=A0A813JBX6_POLGL|nr:unnamed protein product [Polarella glacialis]
MLRSAWRLPVRATASSWRGAQSFALRRGAQSVAEDLTRNSVFGIAQEATEDASNFQSASHDVRRKEAEWRGHDLELLERTRTKDTTALRKKLRHHARSRGWIEAAEFLVAFVDARGAELEDEELQDWERLMACDDMLLMRIVASTTDVPQELETKLLRKMQLFCASNGPAEGARS